MFARFIYSGVRTRRRCKFVFCLSLLLGVGLLMIETLQARTKRIIHGDRTPLFGLHGDRTALLGLHSDSEQKQVRDPPQGMEVNLTEVPGTMMSESIAFRSDHVTQHCSKWSKINFRPLVSHWMMSRSHQFLYCPVEKTASTFWRRFVHQLEYTSPMRSPFDVDVRRLYNSRDEKLEVTESGVDLKHLWANTTKLLFVREPYSRLFSAYVDKLLGPNPIYWAQWGKTAILKYRNVTAEVKGSNSCGDDVTFPEFIQFAASLYGQGDMHLMSINRLCTPCEVNFTVIGKMETFARDTRHLLSLLHINESQLALERMDDDVSLDAVVDSVTDAMSQKWLNQTLRCITKADVVKRIWRKLQIRGFISWRFNCDVDLQTAAMMDGATLIEDLKQAVRASRNKTELGIQKRQAMLEAFSGLTTTQIDAVKRTFFLDFQMFNYKDSPPRVDVVTMTDAFDWRRDWDLSPVL